jgi:hypothetical protein
MQALTIILIAVAALYTCGFIGTAIELYTHRWYLIQAEAAKRDELLNRTRFKLTAHMVALILCLCWPWVLRVELREWYGKRKARSNH